MAVSLDFFSQNTRETWITICSDSNPSPPSSGEAVSEGRPNPHITLHQPSPSPTSAPPSTSQFQPKLRFPLQQQPRQQQQRSSATHLPFNGLVCPTAPNSPLQLLRQTAAPWCAPTTPCAQAWQLWEHGGGCGSLTYCGDL